MSAPVRQYLGRVANGRILKKDLVKAFYPYGGTPVFDPQLLKEDIYNLYINPASNSCAYTKDTNPLTVFAFLSGQLPFDISIGSSRDDLVHLVYTISDLSGETILTFYYDGGPRKAYKPAADCYTMFSSNGLSGPSPDSKRYYYGNNFYLLCPIEELLVADDLLELVLTVDGYKYIDEYKTGADPDTSGYIFSDYSYSQVSSSSIFAPGKRAFARNDMGYIDLTPEFVYHLFNTDAKISRLKPIPTVPTYIYVRGAPLTAEYFTMAGASNFRVLVYKVLSDESGNLRWFPMSPSCYEDSFSSVGDAYSDSVFSYIGWNALIVEASTMPNPLYMGVLRANELSNAWLRIVPRYTTMALGLNGYISGAIARPAKTDVIDSFSGTYINIPFEQAIQAGYSQMWDDYTYNSVYASPEASEYGAVSAKCIPLLHYRHLDATTFNDGSTRSAVVLAVPDTLWGKNKSYDGIPMGPTLRDMFYVNGSGSLFDSLVSQHQSNSTSTKIVMVISDGSFTGLSSVFEVQAVPVMPDGSNTGYTVPAHRISRKDVPAFSTFSFSVLPVPVSGNYGMSTSVFRTTVPYEHARNGVNGYVGFDYPSCFVPFVTLDSGSYASEVFYQSYDGVMAYCDVMATYSNADVLLELFLIDTNNGNAIISSLRDKPVSSKYRDLSDAAEVTVKEYTDMSNLTGETGFAVYKSIATRGMTYKDSNFFTVGTYTYTGSAFDIALPSFTTNFTDMFYSVVKTGGGSAPRINAYLSAGVWRLATSAGGAGCVISVFGS